MGGLKPFKLPAPESRLIVHKNIIYKIKLTYKYTRSNNNYNFLPCAPAQMQREVESTLRAMLQSENRLRPLKIRTEHFLVDCGTEPWSLARRIRFEERGREVPAHPRVLVLTVQPIPEDGKPGDRAEYQTLREVSGGSGRKEKDFHRVGLMSSTPIAHGEKEGAGDNRGSGLTTTARRKSATESPLKPTPRKESGRSSSEKRRERVNECGLEDVSAGRREVVSKGPVSSTPRRDPENGKSHEKESDIEGGSAHRGRRRSTSESRRPSNNQSGNQQPSENRKSSDDRERGVDRAGRSGTDSVPPPKDGSSKKRKSVSRSPLKIPPASKTNEGVSPRTVSASRQGASGRKSLDAEIATFSPLAPNNVERSTAKRDNQGKNSCAQKVAERCDTQTEDTDAEDVECASTTEASRRAVSSKNEKRNKQVVEAAESDDDSAVFEDESPQSGGESWKSDDDDEEEEDVEKDDRSTEADDESSEKEESETDTEPEAPTKGKEKGARKEKITSQTLDVKMGMDIVLPSKSSKSALKEEARKRFEASPDSVVSTRSLRSRVGVEGRNTKQARTKEARERLETSPDSALSTRSLRSRVGVEGRNTRKARTKEARKILETSPDSAVSSRSLRSRVGVVSRDTRQARSKITPSKSKRRKQRNLRMTQKSRITPQIRVSSRNTKASREAPKPSSSSASNPVSGSRSLRSIQGEKTRGEGSTTTRRGMRKQHRGTEDCDGFTEPETSVAPPVKKPRLQSEGTESRAKRTAHRMDTGIAMDARNEARVNTRLRSGKSSVRSRQETLKKTTEEKSSAKSRDEEAIMAAANSPRSASRAVPAKRQATMRDTAAPTSRGQKSARLATRVPASRVTPPKRPVQLGWRVSSKGVGAPQVARLRMVRRRVTALPPRVTGEKLTRATRMRMTSTPLQEPEVGSDGAHVGVRRSKRREAEAEAEENNPEPVKRTKRDARSDNDDRSIGESARQRRERPESETDEPVVKRRDSGDSRTENHEATHDANVSQKPRDVTSRNDSVTLKHSTPLVEAGTQTIGSTYRIKNADLKLLRRLAVPVTKVDERPRPVGPSTEDQRQQHPRKVQSNDDAITSRNDDVISTRSTNKEPLCYRRDRSLIQQEELAEEMKLQQMAAPVELNERAPLRPTPRRALSGRGPVVAARKAIRTSPRLAGARGGGPAGARGVREPEPRRKSFIQATWDAILTPMKKMFK